MRPIGTEQEGKCKERRKGESRIREKGNRFVK